jgi:hypothetical protein
MEKKNFKIFFAMIMVIMVVLFGSVSTSCSNDDDLLLAGDNQTENPQDNPIGVFIKTLGYLSQ